MNKQNLLAAVVAAVISTLGIGGFSVYQGSQFNTYANGYTSKVFNTLENLDKGDTAPFITTVFLNVGKPAPGLPGLQNSVYSASFRSKTPFWNRAAIEAEVREKTGAIQAETFFIINNKILKDENGTDPGAAQNQ